MDYRNFKTPFYEISIGDSSGNKLIPLPHHILRLINKVEIFEPLGGSGETKEFTTINFSIIEGSREPASPDSSLGTSGLYKISTDGKDIDREISGSLTNRTGIITDMRFSGAGGLTFISKTEQTTGKVDNNIQKNVEGKYTSRKWKEDPVKPRFLFNERNQVQVHWGYVEDPSSWRKIRAYIIAVKVEFPENGPVVTHITCQDVGAFADQIALKNGKPFGTRITTPKGNSIVTYKDLPTDELLRKIGKDAGIPTIVSKNLPAEKHDFDKQKTWIAGESFKQFMDRLAELHNCYWKFIPNPESGKDTLVFIKKSSLEARPLKIDKQLLTYRAPGSILKSINVNVDFGGLTGATVKGVDEKGDPIGEDQMVPVQQFAAKTSSKEGKKTETHLSATPVGDNPIFALKSLQDAIAPKEGFVGICENTPRTDIGAIKDKAASEADRLHRLIQLDFSTIGYTKLTPGTVEISGIGIRYSGFYRILSVTHVIDSSGYTTKCSATSQFLPGGGAKPQDAQSIQNQGDVEVQLFRKMQGVD